jgi:uncharacterized protein YkwD
MHGRILATAMTAIAIASGLNAGTGVAGELQHHPTLERAIMSEMNRVRADAGLPALRRVALLARPARAHSTWLARTGAFQHEGPGGTPFWTRLVAAGFPRSARMGENLALVGGCAPATARTVVQGWLKSPGHRANLLSPRFRVVGVGVVSTPGCATTLVTADYGSAR